jgi:hypothetical protein
MAQALPARRPRFPHHLLAYALSLPERVLRQVAAVIGRLALSATFLFPKPIRRSKFFQLVVQRQIKMLTDDVGGANLFPGEVRIEGRDAARLGIGGALDNLFLLTMHASPIWILLAATDLCQGAKAYVAELGGELKAAGLIPEGGAIDRVEDVLRGLEKLSDRASDSFDKPPLSFAEMKTTVESLRGGLEEVADSTLHLADLEGLAKNLQAASTASERSLLEVTTAAAAGAIKGTGQIVAGAAVGTIVTVRFLGRGLGDTLKDYGHSLARLHRLGFHRALSSFMIPLVRSRRRNFDYRFQSFTEIGLSFGAWRKAAWRRKA